MDRLRQLEYFIVVAEECHFGRAAERLHMAQPPLSQQIKRLEQEVGTELFTRTTRRVELTAAGSDYLVRAREILAAVEAADDRARRVAQGMVGQLAIGCVGSVTYSLLPALSRRLGQELPGVEVSFQGEMLSRDQAEALREGSIQLAVMRPIHDDAGLVTSTLRRDRLLAAVPADHPLADRPVTHVAELAGSDLILHSSPRRSAMNGLVQQLFAGCGVTPRVRHEVGETSTMVTLVAGGLGVAIVPEPVKALALDGVRFIPLGDAQARLELVAAHRAGPREPQLDRALAILRELSAPGN
ncbi:MULTISPECIES: LysR family transcriptional regulator [unclassified Luteococcus]|uniref:LysR family transcriptional regulator n=1 Tax=unclassified Luteococcus TaxID=2639923 RepID=UPI00313B1BF3